VSRHGGTLDLEFASCLLPAATGSKVINAIIPIFPLPSGFSLYFNLCPRRDDGSN